MSRIWSMMDVGKRSLANSQTALQTVSHNVANKSTEGYSRQRVEMQTAEPADVGTKRIGMGAKTGVVARVNNPHIEKQLEREGSVLGNLEGRNDLLSRVEQVYNEQANKGLNQFMGEFFNAFRELSNNPESLASRSLVKGAAEHLTKDFARVNRQLTEIQADADTRIKSMVEHINESTREIAKLNEKIQMVEMQGGPANDERDRRDLLVKKLGDMVNIRCIEDNKGRVTVSAGNAVLVSGLSQNELFVSSTPASKGKREGNVEVMYKNSETGTPYNVTRQLTGGKIGGYLEVRDRLCNELIGKMDELAYNLAVEVNRAHAQGYDRHNQTGQLFFQVPFAVEGASNQIKVHEEILQDVGRIVAAGQADSPGDNRIANIISQLQYKQFMDGRATVDDYYSSLVGQVGGEAQRVNSEFTSQKGIVDQLKNLRESISGVSLDEETTKMIEFQKSFDASARLIRTADEMLDTVMRLKPM